MRDTGQQKEKSDLTRICAVERGKNFDSTFFAVC